MKRLSVRCLRIAVVMLAVIVSITSFAPGGEGYSAYAFSKKKVSKKIILKAQATDPYTVTLNWNKIKNPQKGYAVFRDGVCIARLGKKSTSYFDSVDEGAEYTYTIKRWKQKGKGKKLKYKYSKASNSVSVVTPADSGSGSGTGVNIVDKKTQSINCNGNRTLNVGQKYKLDGSASSGLPVTYSSQYPSIASVDSAGLVTALSAGNTYVYIRQAGNEVYQSAERKVIIRVNGSQDPGPGTDPDPGTDPEPGSDPVSGTDPITVDGTFSVNIPSNMVKNGQNVITVNQGEVQIPLTIPAHVSKIEWKVTRISIASAYDTITHRTENNGKSLFLKANYALNSSGGYGALKYVGTLTMEDGYVYNGNNKVDFAVTNTIYPLTGSITDKTYNSKDMEQEVVRAGNKEMGFDRVVRLKVEGLPDGSTVNININEFNAGSGFETQLLFPTMSDVENRNKLELVTPEANWECILFRSKSLALVLIETGSFKMKFPNGKTINFNISGKNPEAYDYYNTIKNIGKKCRTSDELETIKNCIRYSLMNYTYSTQYQDMHGLHMGDCITSNSYFCSVLQYCGINAFLRFAGYETDSNHYHIGVVLKDGTKYIVDCVPGTPISEDKIDMWTSDYQLEQQHRLISWDKYYAYYGGQVQFLYDDDETPMIKVY